MSLEYYSLCLFPLFIVIESIYYFYNKFNKISSVVNTGISLHFHLYFMVCLSFIWRNNYAIYSSIIYFISDLIFQKLNNSLTNFAIFHHSLVLFCCYNSDFICMKLFNLMTMHEISTIFMCLYDLKYISEYVYDKLFSISFIFFRLIAYNFYVYYEISCSFNYTVISLITLFNLMNIIIMFVMKLIPKIFQ